MSKDEEANIWTEIESVIGKLCTFEALSSHVHMALYT